MKSENPEHFTHKVEDEPPEVGVGARLYIGAFYRLTSSRQLGMGVGPIPLSEIVGYAETFGTDDLEMFVEIIQSADATYLKLYNDEQKRNSK